MERGIYMREYVNLYTGEIIVKSTILGARRYFKKDAKKWGYKYRRKNVVSFRAYVKKSFYEAIEQYL